MFTRDGGFWCTPCQKEHAGECKSWTKVDTSTEQPFVLGDFVVPFGMPLGSVVKNDWPATIVNVQAYAGRTVLTWMHPSGKKETVTDWPATLAKRLRKFDPRNP